MTQTLPLVLDPRQMPPPFGPQGLKPPLVHAAFAGGALQIQLPLWQVCSPVQAWPQAPQLFASVPVSAQRPLQSVWLPGQAQAQVLLSKVCPPPQTLFTQVPLQSVWLGGQAQPPF